MVSVDPRDVVTRPCAGRALPWKASFMTIPFEGGFSRKHQIGSSCNSNRPTLGLRAGGLPLGRYRATGMKLCATGRVTPAQLAWCGPFTRSDVLTAGGYPPGTS